MILLDDIVEVLDLPNDDGKFLVFDDLIHRHLLRQVVVTHGLVEEARGCRLIALGRQQKIDGFTALIDRPAEIFSDAVDS